ncbi:cytochrome P450 3A17 [Purpureocillium lavendulum]|uniref:Cytochrome P450 3A17 n=1 Tax=Purpureocillium lavendulum TaxID=1247861 RepID=A0AB34FGU4_9HYPO|nr:cytochrome P450 3A17 [Purpureocillium lavendulum]
MDVPGPPLLAALYIPHIYSNNIRGNWVRKMPALHRKYGPMQKEHAVHIYVDMLMQRLTERAKQNETVNIVDWLNFTTFDIAGDLIFSDSFRCLANNGYHPWVRFIFDSVRITVVARAYKLYPMLGMIANIFATRSSKPSLYMRHHIKDKLKVRMEAGNEPAYADLVTHMLQTARDGSEGMNESEIVQTSQVVVFGASETTATALSGFFFYICKNPRVYDIVTQEIRSAFSSEADITTRHAATLEFLQAAINETLRIYPPVAETPSRVSPGAMIYNEYIPLGAAFKPFSYGPRDCIGKSFALAEMRYLIVRLLYRFDLELRDGQGDWHEKQRVFLIWEKGPLYFRLRLRNV